MSNTFHKILIARVTFSSLNSFRASPGWLGSRFTLTRHSVWGSNQTESCGISFTLISFAPTLFSNIHPHKLPFHNCEHLFQQLLVSDKCLTKTCNSNLVYLTHKICCCPESYKFSPQSSYSHGYFLWVNTGLTGI